VRGHKQWRPLATLCPAIERGQHCVCQVCGPLPGPRQLDCLVTIAAFDVAYGCGPTSGELTAFLGKPTASTLKNLKAREFVWVNASREWLLTEKGWEELEWTAESE